MPQVGVLPQTDYHDLQMERAKREIKEDIGKLKQIDVKACLSALRVNVQQRIQEAFSRG